MNMKMKAIAAAVALAATGGAQAATQTLQSGNSELIFAVWDPVAQVSFMADLAPVASAPTMGSFALNDFLPAGATPGGAPSTGFPTGPYTAAPGTVEASNINWQWNMAADSDWATFVANSNQANWQWQVVGGDSTGTNAQKDQVRFVMTTQADLATVDSTSLSNMTSMKNANSTWAALDATGEADPYVFDTAGASGSYVGNNLGNQYQGAPFLTTAAVDQSMSFFYLTGNCAGSVCASPDKTTATQYGNGATFSFTSNGTLSYTTNSVVPPPVPVPPALWLLGSALVGLVGVARRKVA